MKVLHINTKYQGGGAARAMGRLHEHLIRKGHQSRFLVGREQHIELPEVDRVADVVSPYKKFWDPVLSRVGNRFEDLWGIHPWAYRPTLHLPETDQFQWAEIIDLRNIFGDYLNMWVLPGLSARKPVVWRLPDMWALTGHCAYPYDCQRWIRGCHDCPLLTEEGRKIVEPSPPKWDGTRRSWKAKKKIYQEAKLHVVITTRWMESNVKKGILGDALSITVISNGVDLDVYRPYQRDEARAKLNLPQDRNIVLWAAASLDNLRKGYRYAEEALQYLQGGEENPPLLVTMGNPRGVKQDQSQPNVRHLGFIRSAEEQAMIFAAADLFLCTTLADAQPQTALESIACGTPIIGFDVGPMPEIVLKGKTGLISADQSPLALARIVQRTLKSPDRIRAMGAVCRKEAVQKYDLNRQTNRYIILYEEILGLH